MRVAMICWLALLALTMAGCLPASAGAGTTLTTAPAAAAPTAAAPATTGGWAGYTQPDQGFSLRYPAHWTAETTSNGVVLRPPRLDGAPAVGLGINLEAYTISSGYDLRDWVLLQSRDSEAPDARDMTVTFADLTETPFAGLGDQVVYSIFQSDLRHQEWLWIERDGLVFRASDFAYPEYRYTLAEIVASLAFDAERLAALRAGNHFAGDERALQAQMAIGSGQGLNLAQAAIANRQAAAPAVEATARYTGTNAYGPDHPGYTLEYDRDQWHLLAGEDYRQDKLVHRRLLNCTLVLFASATETLDNRWRQIGGRWWIEAKLNDRVRDYSLAANDTYYIFGLHVPERGVTFADGPCRSAAEQVLATLEVVEMGE